jgi:tetratricopeptide (TPR) repeat protein
MLKKFMQDRVENSLFKSYQVHKVWLYGNLATRVRESGRFAHDQSVAIAALASNLITGEVHDPERLQAMSADHITAAENLAASVVADPEARAHAADAAWWLSQLRLLQGTSPDKSAPTRNRVEPSAYEDALALVQNAVWLGNDSESKYYTTLANTYLYGLEFADAFAAAGEALIRNPNDWEAKRLRATAGDFLKRARSNLVNSK